MVNARMSTMRPLERYGNHVTPLSSRIRHPRPVALLAGACAVALAGALAACPAASAQTAEDAEPPPGSRVEQEVDVSLTQRRVTVDSSGTFRFDVRVGLTAPAEYLEVRVRVRRPWGALLYQKTEIANDVGAGAHTFSFSRTLEDLEVGAGRYPIEVRVLATGAEPTEVEDRLLVVGDGGSLTVAVVTRLSYAPLRDSEGRFVVDPAREDSGRAAIEGLMDAFGPDFGEVALAVPPLAIEEWADVADGFELVGPGGLEEVPADSDVARRHAATLERMRGFVDGRDLLTVPYAEPDLSGLQVMDGMEDLDAHIERGTALYRELLDAESGKGAAVLDDRVPVSALPYLDDVADHVLLHQGHPLAGETSTRADETSTTPGAFRLEGSSMTGLVVDEAVSDAVERGRRDELVDLLFDRLVSEDTTTGPVVVLAEIGPGRDGRPNAIAGSLRVLDELDWVRLVPTGAAADEASATVRLPEAIKETEAPLGYWSDVREARRYAWSLVESLGADDTDAQEALQATLVAESRLWAGPGQRWGLADRGRSHAAASTRIGSDIFGAVTMEVQDVTLAGQQGKVPLSIQNGSSKRIEVRVLVTGDRVEIGETEIRTQLLPAENYVTIPVGLQAALSGDVDVSVVAGKINLASAQIRVRASYLDRLAVVASVVLVLVLLLLYIHRRVERASEGG